MSDVFRLTRREDRPATIEEHTAMRAEIERLLAALDRIGHVCSCGSGNYNQAIANLASAATIARNAIVQQLTTRPMTGHFDSLTPEQQKAALNNRDVDV